MILRALFIKEQRGMDVDVWNKAIETKLESQRYSSQNDPQ